MPIAESLQRIGYNYLAGLDDPPGEHSEPLTTQQYLGRAASFGPKDVQNCQDAGVDPASTEGRRWIRDAEALRHFAVGLGIVIFTGGLEILAQWPNRSTPPAPVDGVR